MGTPMSNMLMDNTSPEAAARAKQQAEAERMARVAGGAGPQPVTPEVQYIQDMVAQGTQNPAIDTGGGPIGAIASLLAPLFAQKPAPQAAPASPVATPPPSGQMTPEEQRQATCLKETGQYCPD